ncbi:Mur ligase [Schizothecium vesticola]|uniref:Mur ligase n=1 Tax=Schizothecium vesticola TaxID=314040 RepID=A0AA40F7Z4_9PEZI|nr:Mur ligase [Schizothecium vesticola]
MIDLGLARVGRLLQNTPQNWKAIHVAGTNGKGSICAYLSAMLRSGGGVSCARFTSPHLVDRWDCIAIDDTPVPEELFLDTEERVKRRNAEGGVGATEFELLTATAFEIFHRQNVDYGVIEVGLGGRLDATNVLKQKAVTVIAKIGLDHQSFLGNTVEDIALQKAGIMRRGVPCVVDGTNQPSILRVIEEHAKEVGADLHYPEAVSAPGLEPHQLQNLACAHLALRLARPEDKRSLEDLLPLIRQLEWPGRLQRLDLSKVTGRQQDVLLDGAHNSQSAEALAAYVQRHLRSQGQPVTWVVAATQGKDLDGIFGLLLQPGDRVSAVRFGPVDGMPWVKPSDPAELLAVASKYGVEPCQQHDAGDNSSHDPMQASGPRNGYDEAEWLIESYKKGETPTFIEHIKAGVQALSGDDDAVLVFSGAPTRKETPLSEARSYHNLALANAYFSLLPPSQSATSHPRILLEERALDSYHNILFSTLLFWRHHGVWPARLTLVSHGFKRTRLVAGHCAAIGFPLERVTFVGISPPGTDEGAEGVQLALGQWEEDPHGLNLGTGLSAAVVHVVDDEPQGVRDHFAFKGVPDAGVDNVLHRDILVLEPRPSRILEPVQERFRARVRHHPVLPT